MAHTTSSIAPSPAATAAGAGPAPKRSTRRQLLRRSCVLAAATTAAPWAQRPAVANALPELAATGGLHTLIGVAADMPVVASEVALLMDEVVDNGAVVPVKVASRLAGPQDIFIVVPENPHALAAQFHVPEGTRATIATRIRLAQSATVFVAVVCGGTLYCASRDAKVTVGGCN